MAVLAGLGLTALWFIPLGLIASTVAGSSDPGAMVYRLGLGWWGAILIVLATLTTNFVNIYMSALALKSLLPSVSDRAAIWIIGGPGAAISVLSSAWLDQMANFTLLLAGLFVPIGGLLLAHFLVRGHTGTVSDLYPGPEGAPPRVGLWSGAGLSAWVLGAAAFYSSQPIGGVFPGLAVAAGVYLLVARMGVNRRRGRSL
jgi:purine-cytosine permease-like protein